MILLDLLIGFLKIGCFSFGGAYGAVPLIREVVLAYGWMDEEKLSYMIAVCESTPGPIMVNMATYIGSEMGGLPGALAATAAVVLPAFLIVILLTALFRNLMKNDVFQSVLDSLKACVIGIVLATGVYLLLINCIGDVEHAAFDFTAFCIAVGLCTIFYGSRKILKNGISPIVLISLAGAAGVLIYGWK